MRFINNIIVLALLISGFAAVDLDALAQQPSAAQSTPAGSGKPRSATNVAVLDVQQILREAKAMQSVRDQLTTLRKKYEAEIEKQQADLRTANEDLRRQRSILSPEAFDAERRKFDQKVAAVQRLVQSRNQELERANANAVLQVQKVYNQIVFELANERSYGLIFRKSATIVVHPPIEVTPEVLARLDKRLPTVKVTVETKKK